MRHLPLILVALLCGCSGQIREEKASVEAVHLLTNVFKIDLSEGWDLRRAGGWRIDFPRIGREYYLAHDVSISARDRLVSEVDRRNQNDRRDLFGGVQRNSYPDPRPSSPRAPSWWDVEKLGKLDYAGLASSTDDGLTANCYLYLFEKGSNCVVYSRLLLF